MNARVEELFHEVADLAPEERGHYFTEHNVDQQTREEVEDLVAADPGAREFLLRKISFAANCALPRLEGTAERCGPYRLLDVIGRGGMGAVYRAERADGEVTQQVAVKLLPAGAGDAYRERFQQERQILASLAHPNISRMLDAGHAENGQPFLAMEYIDGKPIDTFAKELTVRQKIALFLKVCAAVAYLHRNLVVHRDLKPSNILVTADGEPKLLDFGIAKLLDVATDATMTSMRMLTPDYASPEQVTGARVSTASDIYSLGAVLYRLLTGKPPREFEDLSSESVAAVVAAGEIVRPSARAAELKGDLDFILVKAMRKDPQERYATVEQFAEDLQAFLESRTVRARSGNAWYRARKFGRRYWIPVTAAGLVVASLTAGLYIANRERVVAQRRFDQVRQLANKVLALDGVVQPLAGGIKARSEIVAMSQQYLEGLSSEVRGDPNLALEAADAYFRVARAQGLPSAANLGQYAQAEVSLRKANDLLEPIVQSDPSNRKALLLSADIAQNRMILANTDHRHEETLIEARKAAARVEAFLATGPASAKEIETAFLILNNVALANKNEHHYDDSIRYARRAVEIVRSAPAAPNVNPSQPLSVAADSLRFSGDLEGALQAIREAHQAAERTSFGGVATRRRNFFNVLWREGTILGQDGNISLNRPDEALQILQQAFDLMEQAAEADPDEAQSRILSADAAREMGLILARRDPPRALAVYDRGLLRLREIKNNTSARRDEARILACSSSVLRALRRTVEAKERIEEAFGLLRQTKDYPTDRIDPHQDAAAVLQAWADHLAETGQPQAAAPVYRELLDKTMAYGIDPQNDLRDATKLSSVYAAISANDGRLGRRGEAEAAEARRLDLWRQWDRKLPNNPFVQRQLVAASK